MRPLGRILGFIAAVAAVTLAVTAAPAHAAPAPYKEVINRQTNECLTVGSSGTAGPFYSGQDVRIATCVGRPSQAWYFQPVGDGSDYYFVKVYDGRELCLDVAWASQTWGANVQIVTCNWGHAQQWRMGASRPIGMSFGYGTVNSAWTRTAAMSSSTLATAHRGPGTDPGPTDERPIGGCRRGASLTPAKSPGRAVSRHFAVMLLEGLSGAAAHLRQLHAGTARPVDPTKAMPRHRHRKQTAARAQPTDRSMEVINGAFS